MPKCPSCEEEMIRLFDFKGRYSLYMCSKAKVSTSPKVEGGKIPYIGCNTIKFREKNVKFFKQQLKSSLIKKPLPKEDYKRIEKAIKKLEQADVNDILYKIKREEENLKKQIETMVRERVDVDAHVKNAYELYTAAFIHKKLADKVGLDVGWHQLDQKEIKKYAAKDILGQQ